MFYEYFQRGDAACAVFISPFHGYRPVVVAAGGWYLGTAEILDYTLLHSNVTWTEGKSQCQ